jgi:hypothetical protein
LKSLGKFGFVLPIWQSLRSCLRSHQLRTAHYLRFHRPPEVWQFLPELCVRHVLLLDHIRQSVLGGGAALTIA